MKTKDLNNEQLKLYFNEHVLYEVKQLINAADAINRQLSIHNGLQYMIVESFAIHLRNLISFFYPHSRRDNDVCAEDFFINISIWHSLRPAESQVLKYAKSRADKEVGHLTTLRQFGTPKSKKWDVSVLIDEIMPILSCFCESADKINLSTVFIPVWDQYIYTKNIRLAK